MHQKVAHLTHAQVVGSIPRHTGGNAHLSLSLSSPSASASLYKINFKKF